MPKVSKRQFVHIVPPGYMHIREWCALHDVRYAVVYSRINQCRLPHIRVAGRYFIPIDCDPTPLRITARCHHRRNYTCNHCGWNTKRPPILEQLEAQPLD